MSVSKWAYAPEKCDGKPCIGDCDMCSRAEDEISIPSVDALEYNGGEKASPIGECAYPHCEECDKYHGHYCTVPMVVSKEIWYLAKEFISETETRLTVLESLVADEIIGSKERRVILQSANPMTNAQGEELNYTWEDFLRKENE